MPWINKEELTIKELNSLCPTYGLFDNVNYEKIEYYKDGKGQIWEFSLCTDGSLIKRMELLTKIQKTNQVMKNFGL
jgi:hypothetical protein